MAQQRRHPALGVDRGLNGIDLIEGPVRVEPRSGPPPHISRGPRIGVAYAGAFSIGVAYLIWYYGVRQLGNTRTAVFSNLVPVVALAAAWIHLGEVPHLSQVAGAAVIIGGVTLAQIRPPASAG